MSEIIEQKETHGFQAEVKQILHLMIHSLYSNKEIFLRELVSNASDAIDKLRFESLTDAGLLSDDPELLITVSYDKSQKTIRVSDKGIGMSHDEVIQNLGTIAKSGTKEFLKSLTGDKAKDSQMIGQFGVGFYSSFIVADKVTVITRKAGADKDEAWLWEASAEGEYTIEKTSKEKRGTDVILHLKDDELEFLDDFRLRSIITKYSDHISVPVMMQKMAAPTGDEEKTASKEPNYEQVNKATALWTRPKNDISDDEYQAFYKHVSHDFQDALAWSHNRVEGKLDYTSLLYIPSRAPYDLYHRDAQHGLKLYVQRVFIMDQVDQFLPLYLRFVKGVVDTKDLPLNVSREILQESKAVDSIRSAVTKRVLDMLEKMAKNDVEKYSLFWKEFGQVIKEGPAEDYANKDKIASLLRFSSTHTSTNDQSVSLKDYIGRMKPEQKSIYYVSADTYAAASSSPHLEMFKSKGIEVLVLYDRIDEWLMSSLVEFDGKSIESVSQGSVDLESFEDEETKKAHERLESELKSTLDRVKSHLDEKVSDVRLSHRLTDSPACLVAADGQMTSQMQKLMLSFGQTMPMTKPVFELNPNHPLVKRLETESEARFGCWVDVLYYQAQLSEGAVLENPSTYVKQVNQLLQDLSN